MKTRDDLTDDEKYFLQVYESDESVPKSHDMEFFYAFQRGKEIHESLKPKQWEPKGGNWYVNECGSPHKDTRSFPETKLIGVEAETKEEAQHIADLRIEREILNARIREYNKENGVVIDWSDANRYIMYDNFDKKWVYCWSGGLQHPGCVYTDEEGADTIVKELNAGLIKGIER